MTQPARPAPRRPRFRRATELRRLRLRLEQEGFPRFEMFILVLLTGLSGLLTSWVLLRLGLLSMPLRYALALGVAYGFFLLSLKIWTHWREDSSDLLDIAADVAPDGSGCDCGGGGVGGDGGGSNAGDALGVADAEALPLLLILLAAGLALSALWVIWSAPALFAELLIDGVLSASLYHRLRGLETRPWLETALGYTLPPFAITGVLLVGGGFWLQHLVPGAHTLGEVLRQL